MSLYKIDRDGNIWEYASSAWKWTGPLTGNPATVVKARSLAGGQLLHRLDEDGSIWQFSWNSDHSGLTWYQIYKDPNTRAIAGGINGRLYQLQGDGRILSLNNPFDASSWQELDNDPLTRAIVVGPVSITDYYIDSLYKLRGDGSIWMYAYAPPPSGWQQIDTAGGTIAIAQDNTYLYKLRNDGSIWVWTGIGDGWVPTYTASNVRSIATGVGLITPYLYLLDSNGVIAQCTDVPSLMSWQQLDQDPAAIAIAVDSGWLENTRPQLYRLNNDGRIFSYQNLSVGPPVGPRLPLMLDKSSFSPGLDVGWVEIDHNPDTISIVAVTLPPLT